jgi:phytol kinase
VPLASTVLGGVGSNLFFQKYAFIGYLVAGWADAIAEPVGTKWGKHRYKVPSLFGVKATRSLEGSLAVFLTGFAAVLFCGWILNLDAGRMLAAGLVCSLTAAVVEAVSHHGLDNLTVQVAVSAAAALILG